MNLNRVASAFILAGVFLASTISFRATGQSTNVETAEAQMIITANAKGSRPAPVVQQKDVTVELKNRPTQIKAWEPLQGDNAGLQLVFLFDESARSYLSLQFSSLRKFMMALPPSAEVAVAYMANGRAVMAQTLTSDHALAGKSLRLTNQIPGISGSPYFCLSDLAKHWPSQTKTRRVVFMVTNGEDPYYGGGGSMQDPYVDSAISDAQKAGLLVYSIYFRDQGGAGRLRTLYGQTFLLQVSSATGGQSYANMMTSPVSFDPYLEQFKTSLGSQYRLTIAAQGSGLQRVKVKSNVSGLKLSAPSAVNVSSVQ